MRFLVDAQLPPALARLLVDQGHDAEHVAAFGMSSASDFKIWRRAAMSGTAIVTKDEDFVHLRTTRSGGPPIVWIHIRNTRRKALLAWFPTILPAVCSALERGEVLIEVIRE